ncbi:MAG TPA: hypothetical protein EYP20_03760 [Aigarchaeota archaeon]|nr:hypothetical protein [Aigarchaeota archaeon]
MLVVLVLLRCVCGGVVGGLGDLRRVGFVDGFVFRCSRGWCLLDWVVKVVKHDGGFVEVIFSPMFSDWNLVHLGRDRQVRLLKELARRIVDELGMGGGVKVRLRG